MKIYLPENQDAMPTLEDYTKHIISLVRNIDYVRGLYRLDKSEHYTHPNLCEVMQVLGQPFVKTMTDEQLSGLAVVLFTHYASDYGFLVREKNRPKQYPMADNDYIVQRSRSNLIDQMDNVLHDHFEPLVRIIPENALAMILSHMRDDDWLAYDPNQTVVATGKTKYNIYTREDITKLKSIDDLLLSPYTRLHIWTNQQIDCAVTVPVLRHHFVYDYFDEHAGSTTAILNSLPKNQQ